MRRTFLHALTATALASAVAIPVATVALAEPTAPAAPAPTTPAPAAALPLPVAEERAALVAERGERRAVTERVAAAKERAAERKAAAKRAAAKALAEKQALAKKKALAEAAAARRAAEEAAERRADARSAARSATPARASRGSSRTALPATSGSPRTVARSMLASRGQADQFSCLDSLWSKESGWSVTADNPTSSAYGIPQALPGSKMASAGSDWRTSARTQIAWGLGYIDSVYGSPCAAWNHSQANNWY